MIFTRKSSATRTVRQGETSQTHPGTGSRALSSHWAAWCDLAWRCVQIGWIKAPKSPRRESKGGRGSRRSGKCLGVISPSSHFLQRFTFGGPGETNRGRRQMLSRAPASVIVPNEGPMRSWIIFLGISYLFV